MSDSLWPHESQHTRPPCPKPTPGVHSNSCPSSWWCHPAISSSVVPFSCPEHLPASGSFPMSQLFAWGGQSIRVSASGSVLPMNTQDWSPLGWMMSVKGCPKSRIWCFQWSCMDVRVGLWRKLSAEELMLLNCGVGEDSWESIGLQGDPTSIF